MSESNLGVLADQLYDKVQSINALNAQLKDLDGERRHLEATLLSLMDAVGTDIARSERTTVSVSETIRPQLQDFEVFARFVLRRKALHLFERRVASRAYNEMKEELKGKPVPGVTEYSSRRLNVRKS